MSVLKSILAVSALVSSTLIATAQETPGRLDIANLPTATEELSAAARLGPGMPNIAASDTQAASALSENSWDFNAPNGVPGFGPMSPADVAKVLGAR